MKILYVFIPLIFLLNRTLTAQISDREAYNFSLKNKNGYTLGEIELLKKNKVSYRIRKEAGNPCIFYSYYNDSGLIIRYENKCTSRRKKRTKILARGSFEYDSLGNLLKFSYSDNVSKSVEEYKYDSLSYEIFCRKTDSSFKCARGKKVNCVYEISFWAYLTQSDSLQEIWLSIPDSTLQYFDKKGRLIMTVNKWGDSNSIIYKEVNDTLVSVEYTSPKGTDRIYYFANGKLREKKYFDLNPGRYKKYIYDKQGRLQIVEKGDLDNIYEIIYHTYNSKNLISSIITANKNRTRITKYTYFYRN